MSELMETVECQYCGIYLTKREMEGHDCDGGVWLTSEESRVYKN